jgi:rubrerythrin
MENSLKGTETEKNLLKAFAGESQARNRYTYFAKVAKKEGYIQLSNLFTETAENERNHAKQFFKHLEGGMVEIVAAYPAGKIGTTLENLRAAAAGEKEEYTILYPGFAEVAKEEGFPKVAATFRMISRVEERHEARYLYYADQVEKGTVFTRDEPVRWKCNKCGYVHEGTSPPEICPACKHPTGYFEEYAVNY